MRRILPGLALAMCPQIAAAQTICVDPGHGGADPGAVGCGYEEEDIVIDVSLRLRDLLQGAGFTVVMTRTNDSAVSLANRASLANSQGAARFMSIHANSAGVVATGIETFCATNASATSIDLRNEIQAEMIATWPLSNRGGKTANFTVLTATNMPATLSELGFINNCSVDVTYLTNPNERQRAAQAHLNALLRHLGQNPMPTTGVLTGVIYEDTGAGVGDTSIRLEGATVTVQETGATDASAAGSGSWRFDLPAGSYTVRAELPGYGVTARTCEVQSGGTTWCSIGLFADGPPRDGGVTPPPDAGFVDSGVDAGMKPAADASVPKDGGSIRVGFRDGGDPVLLEAMDVESGCGCTANARGGAGAAWLLPLLLLALVRRRALVAVAVFLFATTASATPPSEPELEAARTIARGDLVDPVIAPDGELVLVTNLARDEVTAIGVDEPTRRPLVRQRGAGYRPEWSGDGRRFGVRSASRPFSGEPLMQFDPFGTYHGPQPTRARVQQIGTRVFVNDVAMHEVSFAPTVDPTGTFVAYETPTGLFLVRIADRKTFALGRGSAPSFSGDGRYLVFERTSDDGHVITASGLYFVRLDEAPSARLLIDEAGAERTPSLSSKHAGAYRLVYRIDDRIVVRTVRFDTRGE